MNPRESQRGFTSLDVVFLVVVLAGAIALAAWILVGSLQQSNELSAMATLRLIGESQEQFHKLNDRYGNLEEIAAGTEGSPPAIVQISHQFSRDNEFKSYLFRVFVAEPAADPSAEAATEPGEVEPPESSGAQPKKHWCAYAWPLRHGLTGHRTFLIDDSGQIYATETAKLRGGDPEGLASGMAYRDHKPFGQIDTAKWAPIAH